jgi:hypothetical protein
MGTLILIVILVILVFVSAAIGGTAAMRKPGDWS